MVGRAGFEPAIPWSQARCDTKLRYRPIYVISSRNPCVVQEFGAWMNSAVQQGTASLGKMTEKERFCAFECAEHWDVTR